MSDQIITEAEEALAAEPLTIAEAAELLAVWIEPARTAFVEGTPVHISFSPGDGTCYALSFTPAGQPGLASEREYLRVNRDQALLSMPVHGLAVVIAPNGEPHPSYVAEKLKTDNPPLILAAGAVWWFLVGGNAEGFVQAYGSWLSELRPGQGDPLSTWKRWALSGGAWQPISQALPIVDLAMALADFERIEGSHPSADAWQEAGAALAEAARVILRAGL